MMWVWAYFGIGGMVLAGMLIVSRRNRVDSSASELLASLRGPQSSRDKFLEKVLVPIVAALLSITGWPVLLGWVWHEKRQERQGAQRKEEAVFQVRPGDLVGRISIQEVETNESVIDPRGAVPSLPFGHLHQVWANFLKDRPADAELWVFGCDWVSDWRCRSRREGYVWVVAGKPANWMLTRDELLEDTND